MTARTRLRDRDPMPAMTEAEALEFRMPWGKHKGQRLYDCGTDYTRWVAENARDPRVKEAAEVAYGWMRNHEDDLAQQCDNDDPPRDWGDL